MRKDAQKVTVFSKRLREARLQAEMTQAELGAKAGIEEASASARINQYERATHAPNYSTAHRLASVLHVPVSYLYEEDEELATIILKFAALSKTQRSKVTEFIFSMTGSP